MVTKEALLARAQDGRIKAITVEGLDLHVRRLGLGERIVIGDRARAGDITAPHEYLAMCLCHPDGSPFWTLDEAQAFCDGDGILAELVVNAVVAAAGLNPPALESAAKN